MLFPHFLVLKMGEAAEASRTFDMLMGDAVGPRKRFILTHAKALRNLDIKKRSIVGHA